MFANPAPFFTFYPMFSNFNVTSMSTRPNLILFGSILPISCRESLISRSVEHLTGWGLRNSSREIASKICSSNFFDNFASFESPVPGSSNEPPDTGGQNLLLIRKKIRTFFCPKYFFVGPPPNFFYCRQHLTACRNKLKIALK